MDPPNVMTIDEFAAYLKVGNSTLYKLAQVGQITCTDESPLTVGVTQATAAEFDALLQSILGEAFKREL